MNRTIGKVLVSLCVVGLTQAYATSLLPGGTVSPVAVLPPGFPSGPSSTGSCASFSSPCSSTGSNALLQEGASWKKNNVVGANVTFENGVWVDPVTHELDFFYQIQNTFTGATAANNTITTTFMLEDFTGVTTNVYQVDLSGPSGSAFFAGSGFKKPTADTITKVSRSLNGADLTVTLTTTGIKPKTNSAILVVKTNATDFDQAGLGSFSWNAAPPAGATGGGQNTNLKNWTLDALEPVLTPEPGFYGVLSLGIAGLLMLVRRRSGRPQEDSKPLV